MTVLGGGTDASNSVGTKVQSVKPSLYPGVLGSHSSFIQLNTFVALLSLQFITVDSTASSMQQTLANPVTVNPDRSMKNALDK
jgi:hypothetical protein